MINKDKTMTVAELLAILADRRISPDMPLATYDNATGTIRGIVAFEIHTHKDGSQSLSFFDGAQIADIATLVSTAEVFP